MKTFKQYLEKYPDYLWIRCKFDDGSYIESIYSNIRGNLYRETYSKEKQEEQEQEQEEQEWSKLPLTRMVEYEELVSRSKDAIKYYGKCKTKRMTREEVEQLLFRDMI